MSRHEPRVDAGSAMGPPLSRPTLEMLRERIRASCAELEKTLTWGMPHFTWCGRIAFRMATFKRCRAFNLWRGAEPVHRIEDIGMGQFGRLLDVDEMFPEEALAGYVNGAIERIGQSARRVRKRSVPKTWHGRWPPTPPHGPPSKAVREDRAGSTWTGSSGSGAQKRANLACSRWLRGPAKAAAAYEWR